MNTEQVVEMIDAITEGRQYSLDVPKLGDNDEMSITFGKSFITFEDDFDFSSQIDNPRVAREIAGALVAWANRKDNLNRPGEKGNAFGVAMKNHPGEPRLGSREIWFRAHIDHMGHAAKNRNLRDLEAIYNDLHPNSEEAVDIQKAIQILRDNGAQ